MIVPLAKTICQKIFVSVEINRTNNTIEHKLIIHNQSEFTVELLSIETSPKIPLGFGNNQPIDNSNIFKNQTLIPGQKITNTIDLKAIKSKREDHRITVKYKTHIPLKEEPIVTQTSNTFIYKPLGHTVPIRSSTVMKS